MARYLRAYKVMAYSLSKFGEVNVLASQAAWAWPEALRDIFRPRGVNLMVAQNTNDFVNVLEHKRIHATIIDMDQERATPLTTIKIIRMNYPLLPCLMLANEAGKVLLDKALQLDVFSVIEKPVDMSVLREQLDRLFMKKYDSDIFSV